MLNWWSCPKCKGKMFIDNDYYGWYLQCLICGFSQDFEELALSQDNGAEPGLKPAKNDASDLRPDSRAKYG
jgi:hypothetical protein